jgi:IMP dehydrogenase
MASKEVADDHLGGLSEWKTAEGVEVVVPYKGLEQTEAIMQDIIGGLRSGLTYSGAHNIRELQEKFQYTTITSNGLTESHPHKK